MTTTQLTREKINEAVLCITISDIQTLIIQIIAEKSHIEVDELNDRTTKILMDKEFGSDLSFDNISSYRKFVDYYTQLESDLRRSLGVLIWARVIVFDGEAKLIINEPFASSLGIAS